MLMLCCCVLGSAENRYRFKVARATTTRARKAGTPEHSRLRRSAGIAEPLQVIQHRSVASRNRKASARPSSSSRLLCIYYALLLTSLNRYRFNVQHRSVARKRERPSRRSAVGLNSR